MKKTNVVVGDCLEQLKLMPDNSVDSVVTDPPYGWRFMGKAWDSFDIEKKRIAELSRPPRKDGKSRGRGDPSLCAGSNDQSLEGNRNFQIFTESWAREAFRVLKPGGHMLVFCGPRTYHRMASGVEDAGFEIRDQLQWLFGSGFPKSHNLGDGIGSALKPANEPIVLARKPLSERTLKLNHEKWGCGGLNIDASRIEAADQYVLDAAVKRMTGNETQHAEDRQFLAGTKTIQPISAQGRFPANLLLDETAAESLGDPARFFYCAKASKSERNAGLEGMAVRAGEPNQELGPNASHRQANAQERAMGITHVERKQNQNHHPTVKPVRLMEYLIRLVTPPNGIVLDPFMGSGTTGLAAKNLGFKFIGIEMNKEYCEIAEKRIANG